MGLDRKGWHLGGVIDEQRTQNLQATGMGGELCSACCSATTPQKPKAGTHSQYEKGLRQGRGCCQGETPALSSGSLPLPHPLDERLLTQGTFTQWGCVLPKPRLRKAPLGEGHGS